MPPGPRPLPKNITMLRGGRNPRTAAPVDQQPDPPIKIPLPPDGLSVEETDVFVTMARKLAGMRVMSEVDVDALVIYARNKIIANRAHEKVNASSEVIKAPSGYPMQNPWVSIRDAAHDRCMKILDQFGCTPSGRTRISKL